MKKNTKILSLILALAVVLTVFAVAVFADAGADTAEKIPGEYTKIPGSFDPTDEKWNGAYAGMTYGLWSSARAFEAGLAPDYWYTGDLTAENIGATDSNGTTFKADYTAAGYIPSYVYVFTDINTQTAQIPTGTTQKLVIDLLGHTLTMKNGFRVGGNGNVPNASLTIRNGKALYNNGQIQTRSDSSFILENLDFTFTTANSQGTFFYWSQADYLRFTDCKLKFERAVSFALAGQSKTNGTASSSIIFENTDIVYADGL